MALIRKLVGLLDILSQVCSYREQQPVERYCRGVPVRDDGPPSAVTKGGTRMVCSSLALLSSTQRILTGPVRALDNDILMFFASSSMQRQESVSPQICTNQRNPSCSFSRLATLDVARIA